MIARAAAVSLCGFFACAAPEAFAQTNILEIPITRQAPVTPTSITYGPDGNYWFTESAGDNGVIGRINPTDNLFGEVGLTNNPNALPRGIVTGPDGNMWFTEQGANAIGRMQTNGNYLEYLLTNIDATPATITVGPDSNLWFIEYKLSKIAKFNPYNPTNNLRQVIYQEYGPFETSTRFGAPGTNAELYDLTSGPDGNLWFTQATYGEVGKLTTNGVATLYTVPSTNSQPLTIVTGPDGAMWFTEFNTNQIGRITTDGTSIKEFTIPLYPGAANFPEPYDIITGPDGNMWFTEYLGSAIARLTLNGIVTIFPTPTPFSLPTYLATGAGTPGGDSNIYFGEFASEGSTTIDDAIALLYVSQSLNFTNGNLTGSGTSFNGLLGTFQNSTAINTVTVYWGDGTFSTLGFNNATANSSTTITNIVIANSMTNTNTLTVTNVTPIATNGNNGTFQIFANHAYRSMTNYSIGVQIIDARGDYMVATNLVAAPSGGMVAFHMSGTNMVLTWPGANFILQSAPSPAGAWNNISGATSPYTNAVSSSPKFFRLKAF
ncbi:MAG TPA: hypothetical protein VH413_14305 [Verrucomicrobiae bacterium]|nr:hypothetical protein [Verrucomicrobiae bacterium]